MSHSSCSSQNSKDRALSLLFHFPLRGSSWLKFTKAKTSGVQYTVNKEAEPWNKAEFTLQRVTGVILKSKTAAAAVWGDLNPTLPKTWLTHLCEPLRPHSLYCWQIICGKVHWPHILHEWHNHHMISSFSSAQISTHSPQRIIFSTRWIEKRTFKINDIK